MAVNKSTNIEIENQTFNEEFLELSPNINKVNDSNNAEDDGSDIFPDKSLCKEKETSEVDSSRPNEFAVTKGIAEGMMDIALLTANSNQLRFIMSYNVESKTYYLSLGLIIASLILQVTVGFGLIYKNYNKKKRKLHSNKIKNILVAVIFLITVINVLAAAFTTTDKYPFNYESTMNGLFWVTNSGLQIGVKSGDKEKHTYAIPNSKFNRNYN